MKNNISDSPLFCEHANEMPAICKCPINCYCRIHGGCKKKNKKFIERRDNKDRRKQFRQELDYYHYKWIRFDRRQKVLSNSDIIEHKIAGYHYYPRLPDIEPD